MARPNPTGGDVFGVIVADIHAWLGAMTPVLQLSLPAPMWGTVTPIRLPGIQPLKLADWLWVDDAYGAQMALRDRLIGQRRDEVLALERDAGPAAREVLELVLGALADGDGHEISDKKVTRPDGVTVALDWQDPLATAGRLVQEDLCLMQQIGDEYVLTGAVLCFPAGWTLAEKMMRPLAAIHAPVADFSADIARRVERLFAAIRVAQPLWRLNGFYYDDPALFAPFTEAAPRPKISDGAKYFRAERQCLLRLPESRAVVFSIHTFVVKRENLSLEQARTIGNRIG